MTDAFERWYLVVYPHRDESEARRATSLLAKMTALQSRRILDLGCGPGRHLVPLAESGARLVGLDRSATLLGEARRRIHGLPGVSLVRGDMRALPFAGDAFDGVASLFTTFGYESERDDCVVLQEVARVLTCRGFFLLDFLNREHVLSDGTADTERSQGRYRIRERRRVVNEGRRIAKRVIVEPIEGGEAVADYEERVTLYSAPELRALVQGVGLDILREWGGYDGEPFEPAKSVRYIAYAERPSA